MTIHTHLNDNQSNTLGLLWMRACRNCKSGNYTPQIVEIHGRRFVVDFDETRGLSTFGALDGDPWRCTVDEDEDCSLDGELSIFNRDLTMLRLALHTPPPKA